MPDIGSRTARSRRRRIERRIIARRDPTPRRASRRVGAAVASIVMIGALGTPAAGATELAYAGGLTSGSITIHAGGDQQVLSSLSGHLDLSWTQFVPQRAQGDGIGSTVPVVGSISLEPLISTSFGSAALTLYTRSVVAEVGATTGTLDAASGVLDLATQATLSVTVYQQVGTVQSPSTDPVLTGSDCRVNIGLGWSGETTGTTVTLSDPQFTIPTFPSGASACGEVTDQLDARVAGSNNSVSLTFDGSTATTSQSGFLRVTTSPALPATIIVDDVERDSWGLNWVEFAAGTHQICFGEVPGYAKPPCQMVEIAPGATTTANGTYAQRGFLRVITSPSVGSTISVDGVPRNDWGLWTEVPPGTYTVCFGAVQGYDVPGCRDVTVAAGSTASTTGTFVADAAAPGPSGSYGYLRATTSPPTAGMIEVDGLDRDNWGLNWLKLPAGTHGVCFGPAANATAPADCTTASVTAGATTTVTGAYAPKGSLRVVTSPSVPATIRVNGRIANAFGMWAPKAPGTYQVCFGAVPGYSAPPCQAAVTVTAGNTTTITGTFFPQP